jgi:subtilisin family serine protease
VGYIDFINLYQIETLGKNEADLRDNISKAMALPDIVMAFPHQKIFPERSPLDDPVYSKGRDRSYRIAGVPQSWDSIRSSGLALSEAKIGVVDDGLYKGYGEFDGAVRINTKSNGSLLEKPSSEYPIAGSHGTGIMNIIAADPVNGGLVGIASEPLRSNLTVTMINMRSPVYSNSKDAWYMGYMLALSAAGIGSDILSLSWGKSDADPEAVIESRDFFEEWANAYPDRLFVCSAGNDKGDVDRSRRFPYAYHMPNVITVGCINNNGTIYEDSNRNSSNFEVTLAAPGDQVVWGRDSQGRIEDSGGETSMSVPFVTATAALVRSLDPSLNASSIKSLLVKTARKSIDVGGSQVTAPEGAGAGILATDLAVQKVIADLRNSTGVVA